MSNARIVLGGIAIVAAGLARLLGFGRWVVSEGKPMVVVYPAAGLVLLGIVLILSELKLGGSTRSDSSADGGKTT